MELNKEELLMLRDALNSKIASIIDGGGIGEKRAERAYKNAQLRDRVQLELDRS